VNVYPESKYIPECNILLDKLRGKLSLKAYRNAKLYYNIGEYKSAIIALPNVVKDYPETPYKEEIDYLTTKSYFLLAKGSSEAKQEVRYKDYLNAYSDFSAEYAESKFQKELAGMKVKKQKWPW
jgi:outer membrane protein assembly factor BamD